MLKSLDERFDILTKAIMEDAQSDAAKVREDAQQKADEIVRDANAEAASIRKDILDHAHQEAEVLKEEKLSEAKMKAQMQWLEHREVLLDKVFQEAKNRIQGLVLTSSYPKVLENLILETIANMQSDEIILHFDTISQKIISTDWIKELAENTQISLTIGETLQTGTGVTAGTKDGKRQFDNTLETRLQRQQQQLRSSVYHVMMGEKV